MTPPLSANGRLVFDRYPADGSTRTPAELSRQRAVWLAGHLRTPQASALRDAWEQRRRHTARRLAEAGWAVKVVTLTVDDASALVVGHSGSGAAGATSLTLHPVTGQPSLPGSGLKGAARHARTAHLATEPASDDGDPGGGLSPGGRDTLEHVYGVGGDTGAVGQVRFTDAVPASVTVAEAVLTPHHGAYYKDPDSQPGTWENPVPVPFAAVTAGRFVTLVYGRDPAAVDDAIDDLADAGSFWGLGAKTASGFGYVTVTAEEVTR